MKKNIYSRKIYRGGQAIPKPTISFLRSFIDPNAVNKVFNNTAIISISYPTQVADSSHKLDVKLLNPNGADIANIKIKNINNIRELTVSELQASIRYQLTVKLVNKTTNNKSVDSNTLTIEIPRLQSPRPAPRPAPTPSAIPGIITTVVGTGVAGYSGDGGLATRARLRNPVDIVFDINGNLLIVDSNNNRIRRVAAAKGIITTVAGNGMFGVDPRETSTLVYYGDGGLATNASFTNPSGVAVDRDGNLFIGEVNVHRIRRVDARTGILTTAAGIGTLYNGYGFRGDGGPANRAMLSDPQHIALDHVGNVLIADTGNNRIRRVNASTGIITTVAGNGVLDFSGDGGSATSASLNSPTGLAVDASGNLFIADTANQRIRRVDARTRVISTVAGNGVVGFSGDGGPATSASLASPLGVAVDSSGNLFIADIENHRIRRVAAGTGIITTVAGNGVAGFRGDGGAATSASLFYPTKVALDTSGNLLIADMSNHRIRRVNGPFT